MSANNNDRIAMTVAGRLLGRYVLKPLADWRARQRAMDDGGVARLAHWRDGSIASVVRCPRTVRSCPNSCRIAAAQ